MNKICQSILRLSILERYNSQNLIDKIMLEHVQIWK